MTNGFMKQKKLFEPWLNFLVQEISDLVDSYHLNQNINLTSLWFNINGQYSYNLKHTHPGAILSGVLCKKFQRILVNFILFCLILTFKMN